MQDLVNRQTISNLVEQKMNPWMVLWQPDHQWFEICRASPEKRKHWKSSGWVELGLDKAMAYKHVDAWIAMYRPYSPLQILLNVTPVRILSDQLYYFYH